VVLEEREKGWDSEKDSIKLENLLEVDKCSRKVKMPAPSWS
jgi:hypothetical protein